MTEVWLRGPLEGVLPQLMPVVHSLMQSAEEIPPAASPLDAEQLWLRPGGAASVGFHLQHIAGALDRLLTYARGEQLTPEQISAARLEPEAGDPPRDARTTSELALSAIARAIDAASLVPSTMLFEHREVGRARLPSNVIGLLFHCAEHTQRHTGQLVTTSKIIRGLNLTESRGERP